MSPKSVTPKPVVLIADDDPTMLVMLSETLVKGGFEVITAKNGAIALDMFLQYLPDAVLLDGEMPVMDGYTSCRRMRRFDALSGRPILIVTGAGEDEAVERAFASGATDFISKPLIWPVLPHKLHNVLQAHETHNEIAGLLRVIPDRIYLVEQDGEIRRINASDNMDREIDHADRREAAARKALFASMRERIEELFDSDELLMYQYEEPQFGRHYEIRMVPKDQKSALAIVREITEHKESQNQIERLAYYDSLTNLPNRALFTRKLSESLRDAQAQEIGLGLLYIDLDRFKRINDTLGHTVGDKLLSMVAARIQACMRTRPREATGVANLDVSAIARLGGDEFALLVPEPGGPRVSEIIGERIIEALKLPFRHQGHQFVVSPSIGVALYPDDATSVSELLVNADTAMYQAKRGGRNRLCFFSETMNVQSLDRLGIENDLRAAISNGDFSLYYQPKIEVRTGRIVGVEALLRWEHDERGFVSPAHFIPIAEDTGLIVELGRWVVEEAVRQLELWRGTPLEGLQIAVNVSGLQFTHSDMRQTIITRVTEADIHPRSLEIEITESVLMGDARESINTLAKLRKAGVSVAIDDFGTGYSSLAYLKKFPVDKLKIDRSFVSDMAEKNDADAICAAIIAMAHQLGLEVVAEGVETAAQLRLLREKHCDQVQGYHFCRPLPVAELEAFVRERVKADSLDVPAEFSESTL